MVIFLLISACNFGVAVGCFLGWYARRWVDLRGRHYYRRGAQAKRPEQSALFEHDDPDPVQDAAALYSYLKARSKDQSAALAESNGDPAPAMSRY